MLCSGSAPSELVLKLGVFNSRILNITYVGIIGGGSAPPPPARPGGGGGPRPGGTDGADLGGCGG